MGDLKERIFELASQDDGFAKAFCEAETPEAVIEVLKEKGLDVTAEDLQALLQQESQGKVKLSQDELEAVSGGDEGACLCCGAGYGGGDKGERCVCLIGGGGGTKHGDARCFCFADGEGEGD